MNTMAMNSFCTWLKTCILPQFSLFTSVKSLDTRSKTFYLKIIFEMAIGEMNKQGDIISVQTNLHHS